MDKFFVVINESSETAWSRIIWSEVNDSAKIFCSSIKSNSILLQKLKKIHFSNELNKRFWLPFKRIWNKQLVIQQGDLNPLDRNIIIFHGNVKFDPDYILALKEKKNAIIIQYLLDTVEKLKIGKNAREFDEYVKRYHVDYLYSFDKCDCEKYNMNFFDAYSCVPDEQNYPICYDISYVGNCRNEERFGLITKISSELLSLKSLFYLNGVNKKQKVANEGIIYNHILPYKKVLELLKKSNCILELLNESQNGNTLRFKEAICYNKKLLTNNAEVKKSSYYNPEYIQVFLKPEDIDVKWVMDRVKVDYRYKGDFSPKKLFEMIQNDINKRGVK